MQEGNSTRPKPAATAIKASSYVWGIAMVAALGGLLFGYDWVVIGGARQFYEVYFHLSSSELIGWANSCALVGCLIGSLAAGPLANAVGRSRILVAAAILFAVSSILTGRAETFSTFIAWRIIGGVAIGLSSNVSPLYIAEISPANIRGRLVSLNQFAIVIGILLAQIVNWAIARPVVSGVSPATLLQSWNVQEGWRWMFYAVAIPAFVFTVTAFFLPESPRWLLDRGREADARSILAHIGGDSHAASEIANIKRSIARQVEASVGWKVFLRPEILRVVLTGMALAVLQQWTGINILFNYAAEVYRSAGYRANDIFLNIVITGTINLVFTLISMALVDRVGRRRLMIYGAAGIGLSHVVCALAYHEQWPAAMVLALTLSAIACYALTLAPVTWVLIAEIFPHQIRSEGVSGAVSALWIASFLLTYTFPSLNAHLGMAGTFLLYGAICLSGVLFVAKGLPETKGKTLEEIEDAIAVHF
ncbi:MFS transporter, sugar porter (SP) family [Bryocella elongata]|uniref:MFS transporter, sugar porter (SP) family n=1 Tax=Bryocella elongata TaxID=863522 RepID=A0A1H6CII0_9BACT|nr:sugar porter family MFS transporter [Bryocella elongata]SEG72553.1 MFS transporter, sugar porter (SP) family [Bryocella elongata]